MQGMEIIQRVLKISVRIPIVKGGGKEWTSSLKKLEIGSIKNINFDRVCAPKIIICAPNMTFPPKILKIKTFAPKIKRVQKILPPPIYLGGGGNHEKGDLNGQMHRPGYRDTLLLTNYPLWGFSPKVRYPNRNFHAKNWTSQRGARGVVHGKSIFYYFSIGMYRKTLKNGVFGLKYDLDHPKSIFYRKQSTLCTYRNLFNHISGHFIF